jgi:hypothetical protein
VVAVSGIWGDLEAFLGDYRANPAPGYPRSPGANPERSRGACMTMRLSRWESRVNAEDPNAHESQGEPQQQNSNGDAFLNLAFKKGVKPCAGKANG